MRSSSILLLLLRQRRRRRPLSTELFKKRLSIQLQSSDNTFNDSIHVAAAASRRILQTNRPRCWISRVSYSSSTPISSFPVTTTKVSPNNNNNNSVTVFDDNINNNNTSITTTTDEQQQQQQLSQATTKLFTFRPKAYADLAKAKLSALVVTTTAAGFVAAGGHSIGNDMSVLGSCLVGTALCSCSAAAWNQIIEIPRDSRMKRTQQRPLVAVQGGGNGNGNGGGSVLTKAQAQAAATVWGVSGTALLAVGTDPLTATLGLSNIALYAGLYTWMKPRSIYNTWVGAVVGAIPPVMGYTAATAGAGLWDADCLLLGTTLYLWQMPHFFALSYMHRLDYARGGFAMLPLVDEERTANVILRYAAYLSAVPMVSTAMGVTSSMFALEGVALNSYALYVAYQFRQDRTNANARKIFLTSLWYLPSWLVLFLLHSKVWDDDDDDNNNHNHNKIKNDDVLRETLQQAVHGMRDMGRRACLHEQAVVKQQQNSTNTSSDDDTAAAAAVSAAGAIAGECPIVLTKRSGERLQSKANEILSENSSVGGGTATVKVLEER